MNDDRQEILDALDVEFFLEREGLAYKSTRGSSGEQLNVKECPACGDRRSRVYINAETGLGNCFVCNQSFNKLTFIRFAIGEPSWRDTFNYVKEVLRDQGWRPKRRITAAVTDVNVTLPDSFELPTPEGENLTYLEKRGINADLSRYFRLRYCDTGWWNFIKEDGSRGGQKFDERVIIPVYDLDGSLVTFQGRDITGKSDRKYLFPVGLPGTGRFLYNGQNAVKAKRVVVGEGAFDVAAIKKAIDEVMELRDIVPVGSFGKHLSFGDPGGNDQLGRFIKLRADGLESVIMMWDGEEKALIAALEAAGKLTGIGLRVKIALLPKDRDPNEVNPQVVQEAIWKATAYTPMLAVQWRIRNPYSAKS